MQYFIIKSISTQGTPIFWCGATWSSSTEWVKKYRSRKKAEASASRINFKYYGDENEEGRFNSPLTVEEVIEKTNIICLT